MLYTLFLFVNLSYLHLFSYPPLIQGSNITLSKKPIITCNDQTIAANSNFVDGCEGVVNLKASAAKSQDCNKGELLHWAVWIDTNDDGILDVEYSSQLPRDDNNLMDDTNGNGLPDAYIPPTFDGQVVEIPAFKAKLTGVKNKVHWKVIDGCGNEAICTTIYEVIDKRIPTTYCVSLTSTNSQYGFAEIYSIDLNKGSYDNCTKENELLFTFDEEHPVLSKIHSEHYFKDKGLEATELEFFEGIAQKWIPAYRSSCKRYFDSTKVKMSVWDKNFNTDYCLIDMTMIQICAAILSGNITNTKNAPIKNVNIKINGNFTGFPISKNVDSSYYFPILEIGEYNIEPFKSDDYTAGITTMDLFLLQNHLSGKKKLNTPDQLIAADVNGDGFVNNSDYFELKKLVLGMIEKFSNNTSWVFIPKSYVFPDPTNPSFAPRSLTIEVNHNMRNLDFIGIKIGDLDDSALHKLQGTDNPKK